MKRRILDLLYASFRLYFEIISRIIFGLLYWGSESTPLPPVSNSLLTESATSLARKIRTKKVTSEEVVKCFIERITEVNPIINAVVDERFDEAIEEAKAADKFLRTTSKSEEEIAQETPFLGVPVTIKDYYAVKGLKQTTGMWYRKDITAEEDADVVIALTKAGAILLGNTNVPEACMWIETSNVVYGRTSNPYDTRRTPGGSSGGEASIVSACGSPIGIGSDIGGSVRVPSAFNGLFGHKPTPRIVSNKGIAPGQPDGTNEFNTTGPLCRYACDLIPMYKVLAGPNIKHLTLDKQVNLKEVNIYYMEDDGGNPVTTPVDKEIKLAMRKVLGHFKETHDVNPVKVNLKQLKEATWIYFAKLSSIKDATPYSEDLTNNQGNANVWKELIKWPIGRSRHTIAGILGLLFERINLNNTDNPRWTDQFNDLKKEFTELLGDNGVFLYPTHPTTAPYHSQSLFRFFNFSYTGIMNVLGVPSTSCPLGLDSKGLPLAIQVVANPGQDHLCLAFAKEIEEAFGGWVNPSPFIEIETLPKQNETTQEETELKENE